ncbi:hypothetical protein ABEF93_008463 [Exophiala dermatitidis]
MPGTVTPDHKAQIEKPAFASDVQSGAVHRARSVSIWKHICFAATRSRPDRTDRTFKHRMREEAKARKAAQAQELRAQHEAVLRARERTRKASKDRADKYKQDKKVQKEEEKRTQSYYSGGSAWGFDPNAGTLRSGRDHLTAGCQASKAENSVQGAHDAAEARPVRGQTWGVQYGKFSKHVECGAPSLQPCPNKPAEGC